MIYTRWGLHSLPDGAAAFMLAEESHWAYAYERGAPFSRVFHAINSSGRKPCNGILPVTSPTGTAPQPDKFALQKHQPADLASFRCHGHGREHPKINTPEYPIRKFVTVHRGAVYCNTNAEMIIRCDIRDGRLTDSQLPQKELQSCLRKLGHGHYQRKKHLHATG